MSGRFLEISQDPHRCEPEPASMWSVWQCDCGRVWRRAPRPFTRGQMLATPYWRMERRTERLARKWRNRRR